MALDIFDMYAKNKETQKQKPVDTDKKIATGTPNTKPEKTEPQTLTREEVTELARKAVDDYYTELAQKGKDDGNPGNDKPTDE